MTEFHICLLGTFAIYHTGGPLTSLNTPRLQSLLAYLLLQRNTPISRQQLAFLLWPETRDSQARANLRNLLHYLRAGLPDADRYVKVDTHTVQWLPELPYRLDVAEFEANAVPGASLEQLRQAARVYIDDLLPACYDDWIIPYRERLRQGHENVLDRLASGLEEQRRYAEAAVYAQRLIQMDILREDAYRRLMRLHSLMNDRSGALRVYHTCASVLQRELGVGVSSATQEIYNRLLNLESDQVVSAGLQLSVPLVGREQEWAQFVDAWRSMRSGEAGLVLVSGEAGIGKTRLAEEMLDWARRQGIPANKASAYTTTRELAYAPVAEWLRAYNIDTLDAQWLGEVARLLPELLQAHPQVSHPESLVESWQRLRFFEGLGQALLHQRASQFLLLDDIQWCDRETLEWLGYLLRPGNPLLSRRRLLIVATVRSGEGDICPELATLLAELKRANRLVEIELERLNEVETATLAHHLASQALDALQLSHLYQETEGNPLFIVEAIRQSSDTSPRQARAAEVTAARLAQLSPLASSLAAQAAVLGRRFTFALLAQASRESEDRLVQGLDELWKRRIVREQGADSYDFSHDKLREAVNAGLSQAHQRLLHRRAGEALEVVHQGDQDSVAALIAGHYEQAGQFSLACAWFIRAGQAARRIYALEEAAKFFTRVIQLAVQDDLASFTTASQALFTRDDLVLQAWEALGDVQATLGRYEEAQAAFEQAQALPGSVDSCRQADLQRKRGRTFSARGRYEQAWQAYDAAETILGGQPQEPDMALWQAWLQIQLDRMDIFYFNGQPDRIATLFDQIRSSVEQYGTLQQQVEFFERFAMANNWREQMRLSPETIALVQRRFALKQQLGGVHNLSAGHFSLGFAYLWHGDLQAAQQHLDQGLELAMGTGEVRLRCQCLVYLAFLWRLRGRPDRVRLVAQPALELSRALEAYNYLGAALANLAWVAWREGDFTTAYEQAQAAMNTWRANTHPYPFHWAAIWPLIHIELQRGQLAAALHWARKLVGEVQQRLPASIEPLIQAALQVGEKQAAEHLRQALDLAQADGYL